MYINAFLYDPETICKTCIQNLWKAYIVAIRWKLWSATMFQIKVINVIIYEVISDHQWWNWRNFQLYTIIRGTVNSRRDGNTHQPLPLYFVVAQMCLCLLSLIQTIVNKAEKMAYCAQSHLVSNCLLILSPSFSRYCESLRRVTQFVQSNLVKKTIYHTRA